MLLVLGHIQWDEIRSHVEGAEIVCDQIALQRDFVLADSQRVGKLSVDDFTEAYRSGLLGAVFRMPSFSPSTGGR